MKNHPIKFFLASLILLFSLVSNAQVRISDLPEYIGDPTGGYTFLTINGANKKIDAGTLGYNNLDSAAISGNVISFYRHHAFAFSAVLPSGGGSGTVTTVNGILPVNGNVSLSIPSNNSQLANGANYITTSALAPYLTSSAAAGTYQPKGNYLTSETDQTFLNSVAASLTQVQLNNFQTAYSWGNHTGLYPSLSGSYADPSWISSLSYSKLSGAPDLSQYLTQTTADARYALAGQSSFTLQPATTTTLGGVRAGGTGVTIDGNGVINVTSNQTPVSASWGTVTGLLSDQTDLQAAFSNKVDKVAGKALSTNDYDNTQKANVATALAHTTNTSNPHNVTKTQVGLGNVDNTSDATKNAAAATLTNKTLIGPVITSPTGITKADVGLNNIDNTSDLNKPVSTAQSAAIAAKLTANVAITPGTGMKITYDSKGLVTGSSTATTADISPSTNRNYITDDQLTAITGLPNISGKAATVTTNANLTGPVTSVGNTTSITAGAITNTMLAPGIDVAKISGTLPASQTAALTGAVTKAAGSDVTTLSAGIDPVKIGTGIVSATELGYLDGASSNLQIQINGKASLGSPALTGTPTAPTAVTGTSNTQIATTLFANNAAAKAAHDSLKSLGVDTSATGKHTLYYKNDTVMGEKGFVDGVGYAWTYPTPTTIGLKLTGGTGTGSFTTQDVSFTGSTTTTSGGDTIAMVVNAPEVSTQSAMSIRAPLSNSIGNGKAFSIYADSEAYARLQAYTDGAIGIGNGTALRDVYFSRSAANTLRVSSDKASGSANLVVNGKIGIGTTTPNSSALLDLNSTSSGILISRMTAANRTAISSPATGLLVYQTDGTEGFYYKNSTGWLSLATGSTGTGAVYTAYVTTGSYTVNSANGLHQIIILANGTNSGTLTLPTGSSSLNGMLIEVSKTGSGNTATNQAVYADNSTTILSLSPGKTSRIVWNNATAKYYILQ